MKALSSLLLALCLSVPAFASMQANTSVDDVNLMDELNPYAPNIEEQLQMLDEAYEEATGESAIQFDYSHLWSPSCYREQCPVYLDISKAEQKAILYVNGNFYGEYLVSTGLSSSPTPNFDTHPNGRIYDRYTSTKFPGGDYTDDNGKKLGNMPYAVFIRGGFAVHGTGRGNWKKLGQRASHGCIRMHPDNAYRFNRLVRSYGVRSTWIRVR